MKASTPYILMEHQVDHDLACLDRAWQESPTFAFVATRSGVAPTWVEERLAQLPDPYRHHHFILLTSGSTGRPKLVVGRRDRAEQLVAVLHQQQESDPVAETLCALPLTYCYAFVNQWLWARQLRRRLVVTPGLAQPDVLKQAFTDADQAMICLVGAQVSLLSRYYGGQKFPGIIRVHFAGGRFPQEHLAEVRDLFPRAIIFNNYGCAEAMPRLTVRRAESASEAHHVGFPLPGIEMKADPEGRLLFRSPYGAVALGDESGWMAVEPTTWVPSGDLGLLGDDGHVELLGRQGEVFKRYGEKISLRQIMSTLQPAWRGTVEYYREIDARGEAGFVVVLAPHPGEGEVVALLKALSLKHPRTHWPLRVESVESIPLLANNKVDREGLARQSGAQIHWRQRI